MATKKMPIGQYMAEVEKALNRKDGYIMGATGQDPKKWATTSWWFTQYNDNASQKKKALYWRENAARVWDCNGLPEGIYKDFSGVSINTKARYNYSGWCGTKGTGMIPAKYRVPGAAVFWGNKASTITHVAYLYKPVNANNPAGDWYLIEARGVLHGVVKTKLLSRKPNYWGLMTKYFDYENSEIAYEEPKLGERILKNGMEGEDVKEMQSNLITLGYDCGKWGADGDFGDATEIALMAFQTAHGVEADGEYGPNTHAAMVAALGAEKPVTNARSVEIVGGNCWVRTEPNTGGDRLGVAYEGEVYPFAEQTSDNGWHLITYKDKNGWVSGKYSKLKE